MENISKGTAEKPRRYDQPRVGITNRASRTSKHAPIAQNISTRVTHVALALLGRNSAYKVTLKGEQMSMWWFGLAFN